ncbi:MAG TPA: DUF2007 domain-containing protein [Bryobacteraceae bacterium]|nr:DUF2007 domain-containing protein [Bryobacteraceae bacterium]
MYCPECEVEYRAGFTECSDCHVPLVEQLPMPAEVPSPNLELVRVLEGNNLIVESVAKMSLEQAGIPYFVENEEVGVAMQAIDPHIYRWWGIQVARDHEAEARALLQEAIAPEDLALDVDQEPVAVADEAADSAETKP